MRTVYGIPEGAQRPHPQKPLPMTLSNNTELSRDGRLFGCGERAGESPQKAEDAVRVRLGETTEDHRPGRVLEGPTQRWYGHLVQIVRLLSSLSSPLLPQSQCCPQSTVKRLRNVQRLLKRPVREFPQSTRRFMRPSQNLGEPLIRYVSLIPQSPPSSPLFYFLFGSAKIYNIEMLFTCPTLTFTLPT